MRSEFDWIVEHENLPPDEPSLSGSPGGDRNPRRLPWWVWPTVILLIVGAGIVALLWALGGGSDPLPQPELEQVQTVAGLEVNALQARDAEILAQLEARREADGLPLEPPAESWLSASADDGLAGYIALLETELIAPGLARAKVELVWDGIPYHLNWIYASAGDRWVRTTAPPVNLTHQEVNSVHIALTYQQPLPGGDSRFMGQLEAFVIRFCELVPCPPEPFQATLWQDPELPGYVVARVGPLDYRFPLLESMRWPAGGGFEPVLLGSFARHLAYDLAVGPRLEGLARENRSGLALSNYWLAHRLLGLDLLPCTRWLEDAAQRDGTQAALDFIEALADNVPPQQALGLAFGSETITSVWGDPDYFAWLLALRNEIPPSLFDQAVDPWAPDGRVHAGVLPELELARFGDGWVMAAPPTNSGWTTVNFFRREDGRWIQSDLPTGDDYAILGALASTSPSPAAQSWPQITDAVTWTGSPTLTLRWHGPPTETIPPGEFIYPPLSTDSTTDDANEDMPIDPNTIEGITLGTYLGQPVRIIEYRVQELDGGSSSRFFMTVDPTSGEIVNSLGGRSSLLANGMLAWEAEQVLAGPEGQANLTHWWEGAWRPPETVDSPDWRPLSSLWSAGVSLDRQERAVMLAHARLVVAYVIETQGPGTMVSMIDALDKARSFTSWITMVVGQSIGQFEHEWRAWVIDSRPVTPAPSVQ